MIQQQPDIIIAHLTRRIDSLKPIQETTMTTTPSKYNEPTRVQNPLTLTTNIDRTQRERRERAKRIGCLNIPIQLINFAWEIELSRSRSGWNIYIRTSNYVPLDSPIFNAVGRRDIHTIKELFRRGEASVNDVVLYGSESDIVTLVMVGFQSRLPCPPWISPVLT